MHFYVYYILIQGTMVEQLCLNGFTLYKYICNKKIEKTFVPIHHAKEVLITRFNWGGFMKIRRLSLLQ